uniref:AF4/FMR2 family member 4-like isoform X3 n=3 Tax=Myxine glutinosa TaxID=7769 RepID=UPI00358F5ABE
MASLPGVDKKERAAARRREWERRNQEALQQEAALVGAEHLFKEPYKTNKGDELSSLIQNTLGNYDEMKDILSNRSNQSRFVGIPAVAVPLTPNDQSDQSFFSDQRPGAASSFHNTGSVNQTARQAGSVQASSSSFASYSKKGAEGRARACGHSSSGKGRHSISLNTASHGYGRDSYGHSQGPSTAVRHGYSARSSASVDHTSRVVSGGLDQHHSRERHRAKSPRDTDNFVSTPPGPGPPTGQTFPASLSKVAPLQQKPTAYVRPMDGQDQAGSEASVGGTSGPGVDSSFGLQGFGGPTTVPPPSVVDSKTSVVNAKAKLSKLTIPAQAESGNSNDVGVEEILREMTQWPSSPLTAIQTPVTAKPSKFPFTKDSQHVGSSYSSQKRCSAPTKTAHNLTDSSNLADDLKLSSDESDNDQVPGKATPAMPVSMPVVAAGEGRRSSAESGSSSESESSSGSDSESSSSDSEGPQPAVQSASPQQPEPPPTNKWKLDNWLSKVNRNANKSPAPGVESGSTPKAPSHDYPRGEIGSSTEKGRAIIASGGPAGSQEAKEKTRVPGRERGKAPRHSEGKTCGRQKSPGQSDGPTGAGPTTSSSVPRRSVGRKQPKKVEKSSGPDEDAEYSEVLHKGSMPSGGQGVSTETTVRRSIGRKQPRRNEKVQSPDKGAEYADVPHKSPAMAAAMESSVAITSSTVRRSVGRKQPRRTEKPASPEEEEWCKTDYVESLPSKDKTLESSVSTVTDSSKGKAKGGSRKATVKKEPHPAPTFTAETKHQRVPAKSMPISPEFVDTDTSSSSSSSSSLSSDSDSEPDASKSCKVVKECDSPGASIILPPLTGEGDEARNVLSLIVKIDLKLLAHTPPVLAASKDISAASRGDQGPVSSDRRAFGGHRRLSDPHDHSPLPPASPEKVKRKRQSESVESKAERKKVRQVKESHSNSTPSRKITSSKESCGDRKKGPAPLTSPSPQNKRPERERRNSGSSTSSRVSGMSECTSARRKASSAVAVAMPQPPSKHRKLEGKGAGHKQPRGQAVQVEVTTGGSDPCHTANGPPKPALCPVSPTLLRPCLDFDNKPQSVDFHMQEAKKLKHKADGMSDKLGKAINYTDAGLSFIECGNAMERDPLEAKSPFTMYSETTELIRYAMKLKSHSAPGATAADKKLGVFSHRCLALLHLRMFKLKKDSAMKYSKSLLEHFKNASKMSQTPPWGGRGNGTPSPMSPTPSPAGSVASQGSSAAQSNGQATVTIPQRIHQMAASHVTITNNFLYGFDHWEQAETLTKENHEFFSDLDQLMGSLTLNSTMTELVRYCRQGLHWLRFEGQLL